MIATRALKLALSWLSCAAAAACAHTPSGAPPTAAPSKCVAPSAPSPGSQLRWYHDDFQAAISCSRERDVPLVVDLWAPWCHSCLSMKHYVLEDAGLAPLAERFVWLAIDTDRPENAAVVARYQPQVWPTFLVLDPAGEVQARHLGSASVAQLREFLHAGERGHLQHSQGAASDPALGLVREGDRNAMAGRLKPAAMAYRKALATAPSEWPRRAEVLVSLISALHRDQDWAACVDVARENLGHTGQSSSAADFVDYAADCAGHIDDPALAQQLWRQCARRLESLVADPGAPLSQDDRSEVLRISRELQLKLGDQTLARTLAEQQAQLLDRAAEAAPSPEAAMTYNWPRAEVYVFLGRGQDIIPALARSAAELPDSYDPPYRLAWVHLRLLQLEQALAHAERARQLVYGPRTVRVLDLLAKIHAARGEPDAELQVWREALAFYQSLPEGQRQREVLEQLETTLREREQARAHGR